MRGNTMNKLAEIRVDEDGNVYLLDKAGNKFLLTPFSDSDE